jgi:hypothetical protein
MEAINRVQLALLTTEGRTAAVQRCDCSPYVPPTPIHRSNLTVEAVGAYPSVDEYAAFICQRSSRLSVIEEQPSLIVGH